MIDKRDMKIKILMQLLRMVPYLVVTLVAFYVLPLLIVDTGSGIAIILGLIPITCFVCAMFYGYRQKISWFYAPLVALLYIPTIPLYYNSSAWPYVITYGLIALTGSLIGKGVAILMR